MSLTSYRAAPPRVILSGRGLPGLFVLPVLGCLRILRSGGAAPPRVTEATSLSSSCDPEVASSGFGEAKVPFEYFLILQRQWAALRAARCLVRSLPGCNRLVRMISFAFCRPGSDLLSRALRQSTISAGAFHGRVRNGIGCSRSAITTRSAKRTLFEKLLSFGAVRRAVAPRAQVMRTIKPIELLVPVNFMRCRTSIPGLSTWSSSTALREYSFQGGFPA